MAERRMLSKKITDTDAFAKMPSSAQALYFHLNQGADDDGFNDQVSVAMHRAHAGADDLTLLIARGYVFEIENGVVVIRHWRIHNLLRQDRYKETVYIRERAMLSLDHGVYIEKIVQIPLAPPETEEAVATWLPFGCQLVATGEGSVGKDNNSLSIAHARVKKPYGQFENVMLSEEEYEAFLKAVPDGERRIEVFSCKLKAKGYRYDDHYATLLLWYAEEKKQKNASKKDSSFDVDDFFAAALNRTYREGGAGNE